MSWFKRGKSSDNTAAERTSDHGNDTASNASRSETDPDTCLEVFKNHWTQALSVISRTEGKNGVVSYDDVEAVVQNIQQMVNLLAAEEGLSEDGQGGMPGPILHYLLENNIFEKYYSWCQVQTEYKSKLKLEQLRMFENLIGQTNQILLIHKAVINPLLKLLSSCSEGNIESNLDRSLVLVLHQICACISHQTMILESFFNANANHGPAKFLIFSLLISYIHHEGIVGQQARDALLLIMTLSYKNKHVGEFIAQQSDFCPVLATGLSGLYSSLPRKLPVMTDDWSHISQHDIDQVPGIQMLLNTLEFCNAVVQVAHHSIGEQLIDFIYKGFLVPVMGPALHQDVSGLPLPLLDSPMFANSREEVIAATAYLELFLRKISEPHLTHAFIRFIMTEQNDEIVILDSLVTRINSSSKLLCVTSLSLFRTLIGLNCEDVLFQLVFRHLIPCNHMMISQRGSVKDIDLYGKCAEKFLCLRPRYSTTEKQTNSGSSSIVQPQGSFTGEVLSPSNTTLSNHNNRHNLLTSRKTKRGLGSFLEARRKEQEKQRGRGTPGTDSSKISVQEQLERYESSYIEYLSDARMLLSVTVRSCNGWVYPYNGEYPTPNVFELLDDTPIDEESPSVTPDPKISEPKDKDDNTVSTGKSTTSTDKLHLIIGDKNRPASMRLTPDSPYILPDYKVSFDKVKGNSDFRSFLSVTGDTVRTDALTHQQYEILQILRAFDLEAESWCGGKEGMEEFMKYLSGTTTPPEMEQDDTINESLASLDSILFDMCSSTSSTPLLDVSQQSLLADFENSGSSSNNHNDDVFRDNSVTNEDGLVSKATCDSHKHVTKDKSEFVEISMSHFVNGENAPELLSKVTRTNTDHADHGSDGKNVPKSVSFDLPVPSKHLPVSSTSSGNVSVPTKPAESKKKPAPDDMTTIGPFLSSLFSKLEGMLQNTLSINLVLTSIIARLAAYPHPLLRSFLLNHNLVFQPSVKSLIQVLTTVKQKLEHFSYTVPNFDDLLLQAHKNLALREENWKLGREHVFYLNPIRETQKPKVLPAVQAKDKKKLSLSDLFKRSPGSNNRRLPTVPKSGGGPQLERIGQGYRYVSRRLPEPKLDNPMDSPKIRNSVYCAIVFEEFLKELAALSQEHSVVVDVT